VSSAEIVSIPCFGSKTLFQNSCFTSHAQPVLVAPELGLETKLYITFGFSGEFLSQFEVYYYKVFAFDKRFWLSLNYSKDAFLTIILDGLGKHPL